MTLSEKLLRAREERGWTLYKAAKEAGLGRAQLAALEGRYVGRSPNPSLVTVGTVAALIQLYWPQIQLSDFLPGIPMRLIPTDFARVIAEHGRSTTLVIDRDFTEGIQG
jgi:transcriptional regulator with XRE-family HTH domain